MRKNIEVDGKQIPFEANGATPRRYRSYFQQDFLLDIQKLNETVAKGGELDPNTLELFENVCFVMAKQADPEVPDTPDEWLADFEMFSIYQVFPQVLQLWNISTQPTVELKKKKRA